MYIITGHTVALDDDTNGQLDTYSIVYGPEVLKAQYAESQISTVKPGASPLEQLAPGKDLHLHHRYGVWPQEPDVSQVPRVGERPDIDGHPAIAIQSVSAPCMCRNGDTLHYVLAPNGGVKMWEYVNFDILEETSSVSVAAGAAQSAPPRKDIPAIAIAAEVAKVGEIKWDVNATEWPLGEERLCVFFGGTNFAGCWDRYDPSTGESYNRDDHPNDRTYLMKASLPENVKQALAEEHNQRVYCVRDECMHLSCPRGGIVK